MFNDVINVVSMIFIIYLFLYCSFLFLGVFVGIISLYKKRVSRKFQNDIKRDYYLPISIICPAFNEELIIIKSVESLLTLDYKNYELVVVDDGSKDDTSKLLIEHFDLKKVKMTKVGNIKTKKVVAYYSGRFNNVDIVLVIKENGKKADSVNAGINVAKYGYIITMDADTILPKNSLEEIVKPVIMSSKTIAVGGCVKLVNNYEVENGILTEKNTLPNFLLGIQELLYDRSFLSSKFLFNGINCNTNISGAQGLFKKSLVMKIGGYNSNTIGEDMDLVLRLHKYCLENKIDYNIKYVETARCYTQAPDTLKAFTSQQRRWYTGLIQCLYNYKEMLYKPKYGLFGTFAMKFMFLFEFLAPIIDIVGLISLLLLAAFSFSVIESLVVLGVYIALCSLVSFVSFLLRIYNENFSRLTPQLFFLMLFYSIIENIGFRQFMNIKRLDVLFRYNKYSHSWTPIPRKAL